MIYFSAVAAKEYQGLGPQHERTGYFASRAAPMGAVTAEVVIATFFNFNPELVAEAMAGAWEVAEPLAWVEARMRGVDASLRKYLGDDVDSPEMKRAAELARVAAESCGPAGRPLAGGLLGLDWPEPTHLSLWHAIAITREFRGDGHVAVLVANEISPIQSLLLHAGTGEIPASILRLTRAWPQEDWDRGLVELQDRGLLNDDGVATESGRAFRDDIETRTDIAAMSAWEGLGAEGCDELRSLVRPYSKALVSGGAFAL